MEHSSVCMESPRKGANAMGCGVVALAGSPGDDGADAATSALASASDVSIAAAAAVSTASAADVCELMFSCPPGVSIIAPPTAPFSDTAPQVVPPPSR